MNTHRLFYPAVPFLLMFCLVIPAWSAGQSKVGVGGRMHAEHKAFTDLPFSDGDISYAAAYEWHEDKAYWQVALYYAPDVGGKVGDDDEENRPDGETVLTPAVSLIAKDRLWRGGIGLLRSLVEDSEGDEWTDIYWQFSFGIQFPIAGVQLDLFTHYIFEDWSSLDQFDTEDLDYGLWATFAF